MGAKYTTMINAQELKRSNWHGYQVDTDGNVYSKKTGNKMKLGLSQKGYSQVSVSVNGKECCRKVHRIVAEAFIPNPCNKPTVNHKDLNKLNNCVDNLEWATHKEQVVHAVSMDVRANWKKDLKGTKHTQTKLTDSDVLEIRRIHSEGELNYPQIGKMFKIGRSGISHIVQRRSWSHIEPGTELTLTGTEITLTTEIKEK